MIDIGNNIKILREQLHLTQEKLSQITGVAESTISKYENNKVKQYDYFILHSITSFFGISTEQLTSIDFSSSNIHLPHKIKTYRLMQLIPYIYPSASPSDSTFENDSAFNHGYKLQKEIEHNSIHYFYDTNMIIRNCSLLFEALNAYLDSIGEHHNLASCINILGVILQIWFSSYDININRPTNSNHKVSFSDMLRAKSSIAHINSYNWTEEQAEFFSTFNDLYLELINELKSTKFHEIADFYLAARYIWGMVDSSNDFSMLQKTGTEMLYSLGQLGNQYAISFFEKVSDILE